MHAIVRVLRHAVDGENMGAVFDLVALAVGDADFHMSEIEELESLESGGNDLDDD